MQAKQLWQAVLSEMERRLSRTAFDSWLRQTTIVDFADDVATIGAANTFSVSTLQTRYGAEIERVITEIVGRPIRVAFTVFNSADNDGLDNGRGVASHAESGNQPRSSKT